MKRYRFPKDLGNIIIREAIELHAADLVIQFKPVWDQDIKPVHIELGQITAPIRQYYDLICVTSKNPTVKNLSRWMRDMIQYNTMIRKNDQGKWHFDQKKI